MHSDLKTQTSHRFGPTYHYRTISTEHKADQIQNVHQMGEKTKKYTGGRNDPSATWPPRYMGALESKSHHLP